MAFRCPACGVDVATRVLADPVTLIVVGRCDVHGISEVSRVYIGEQREPYPADPTPAARERVAYKPGPSCGRRLNDASWCQRPIGHQDEHAA